MARPTSDPPVVDVSLAARIAALESDMVPVEALLATYGLIGERSGQMNALAGPSVRALQMLGTPTSSPAGNTAVTAINWNAEDHAVAGKTTKLRLKLVFSTNNAAPATTFTFTLNSFTAPTGANSTTVAGTTGPALGTITFTTPAANTMLTDSVEIVAPPTGLYLIVVSIPSSMDANSSVAFNARLEVTYD